MAQPTLGTRNRYQSPEVGEVNGFKTAIHSTSEALKRITMAVSGAIFSKDLDNPIVLDNLSANFRHKCDSRQPTTYSREAYLTSVKEWALRFPLWTSRVLSVTVLELDEAHGYAEILSIQHVTGLQGPDSSVQCSTVWKWKLTAGEFVSGRWKAVESYSAHHPLPDDFPLVPAAVYDGLVAT